VDGAQRRFADDHQPLTTDCFPGRLGAYPFAIEESASPDPIERQIRAKSLALVLSIDGQPADE
jgi:hypothetical protein